MAAPRRACGLGITGHDANATGAYRADLELIRAERAQARAQVGRGGASVPPSDPVDAFDGRAAEWPAARSRSRTSPPHPASSGAASMSRSNSARDINPCFGTPVGSVPPSQLSQSSHKVSA